MEILGYVHAYAAYEEAAGIEYEMPDLQLELRNLPSSAWLSFLAAGMLISGQALQSPALALSVQTPGGGCLNARYGPGEGYGIHTCVDNGKTLARDIESVLNDKGERWLRLSTGRWVNASYTAGPYYSLKSGTHGVSIPDNQSRSVLRRGDRGEDVRKLQQTLTLKGHLGKNQSDGIYGSMTEAAVRKFQVEEGLAVDGIYGPKTAQKMLGTPGTTVDA